MPIRPIKFRARIEFGEDPKITGLVLNISVICESAEVRGLTLEDECRCAVTDFNKAIEHSGYKFDGVCQLKSIVDDSKHWLDADELGIEADGPYYIRFKGVPEQYLGCQDQDSDELCENDLVLLEDTEWVIKLGLYYLSDATSGYGFYLESKAGIKQSMNFTIALNCKIIGNCFTRPEWEE